MSNRQKERTASQSRQPSERDLLQVIKTLLLKCKRALFGPQKTVKPLNKEWPPMVKPTTPPDIPDSTQDNPFREVVEELKEDLRFEECNQALYHYLVGLLNCKPSWIKPLLQNAQYHVLLDSSVFTPPEKEAIKRVLSGYKMPH